MQRSSFVCFKDDVFLGIVVFVKTVMEQESEWLPQNPAPKGDIFSVQYLKFIRDSGHTLLFDDVYEHFINISFKVNRCSTKLSLHVNKH